VLNGTPVRRVYHKKYSCGRMLNIDLEYTVGMKSTNKLKHCGLEMMLLMI